MTLNKNYISSFSIGLDINSFGLEYTRCIVIRDACTFRIIL